MCRARLRTASSHPSKSSWNNSRRLGEPAWWAPPGGIHAPSGVLGGLLFGADCLPLSNRRHRGIPGRDATLESEDSRDLWSVLLPHTESEDLCNAFEIPS